MIHVFPRPVVQDIILRLPPPISTNAIWRSFVRGGRATTIKSADYRKWMVDAGAMLEAQRPGRVEGAYKLSIALPIKCRIDLDNTVKAYSDLLETHQVVANDRLMQRLEVWRGEETETVVWIERMQP